MTTETNFAQSKKPRTKPQRRRSALAVVPRNSDVMIKLLLRAKGATSAELIAATGWQSHSIRAFLSGLRKKGLVLVREARKNGEFSCRIEDAPIARTPVATATCLIANPAEA